MSDEQPAPSFYTTAVTNVSRLLYEAEEETDPQVMERLNDLARTWLDVARLLTDREHM